MTLQNKILAVSLPFAIAAGLTVAIAGRSTTESLMVEELGRRLRPQTQDAAAGLSKDLESRREGALLARLQSAQAFSGAAFAEALLPDGTVAAHTNVLETGKVRSDAASVAALNSTETEFARSEDARGPLLVLSSPVWRTDEEFLLSGGPRKRLGTLRVGIPLGPTLDSARRIGAIVATLAAGVCVGAIGLSLLLLRVVLGPVRAIAAATARVAAGDYAATVPVQSRDELGELAEAFNRMGSALSRTVVSRDRLEEALATARATIDASADGILVVDQNLRAVTYNRRFAEMWGLTDEDMRSGDVRLMARRAADKTEDPEGFLAMVTASVDEDSAQDRRDMIRLKDGRVFDRIARPYQLDGRVIGRTVTTRDLTLHLEGVRALAQARDEALEAARLKSQFLANVSHELRTPLNAVVGTAELLRDATPQEQAEHAATLASAAKTLLDLVDGVLDFSKIEAGRMTVERAPLTPSEVLNDAAALVAARAAEKRVGFEIDAGEAADWKLLGDPTRLRQVLLNLMSNAVKFTERGSVSARAELISSGDSSAELEFSVRDTGIGITREQAARLFAPFTQGDGSTTRRYGGTGLGLAISKSLVELMGGQIGFDSEPGRGTRFWFRVRLDRAAADAPVAVRAAQAAAPPPAGPRDRLRVLLVEDNETNRRLIRRQLERLGAPVTAVPDGTSAIEALFREEYGLVLLDCQMPGLDGYETAAEVRRREDGKRRVPIVAISANVDEEDRRRCLAAGMDDFVPKPATLEHLSAALERWDKPYDEAARAAFAAVAADSPAQATRLLADFVDDCAARLLKARAARSVSDFAALAREAHAIKGASASVGARGMRELARRLEAAAKAQASPERDAEFESLLVQADAEVSRLRAAS